MGCWGTHWQESDNYMNTYHLVLNPIEKILKKKHSNDWVKLNETSIVAVSGLLLDITGNQELYYLPEKELVEKAIEHIERVLKLCDFDSWSTPNKRRDDVLELLEKLKERHNQKHRYTTLGEKIKKHAMKKEESK